MLCSICSNLMSDDETGEGEQGQPICNICFTRELTSAIEEAERQGLIRKDEQGRYYPVD
jgi:hypothetical protein